MAMEPNNANKPEAEAFKKNGQELEHLDFSAVDEACGCGSGGCGGGHRCCGRHHKQSLWDLVTSLR